jgi:hypothetical protein
MLWVSDPELHHSGLPYTQHLARPAQLEVLPRNFETVVCCAQRSEPLARHLRKRRLVHQYTAALHSTATYTATQLMQLREPEPLGILDNHEGSVRNINPDFDDRCRDQQVDFPTFEGGHTLRLVLFLQTAVHQADRQTLQQIA